MIETRKCVVGRGEFEEPSERAAILWAASRRPHPYPVLYTVQEDSLTFWWREEAEE